MRYLIAILVIVACIQAFTYWPIGRSPLRGAYEWKSEQEKKEFHKLLRKHGLHKQISVIFNDGKQEYFINKRGQKCRFI